MGGVEVLKGKEKCFYPCTLHCQNIINNVFSWLISEENDARVSGALNSCECVLLIKQIKYDHPLSSEFRSYLIGV